MERWVLEIMEEKALFAFLKSHYYDLSKNQYSIMPVFHYSIPIANLETPKAHVYLGFLKNQSVDESHTKDLDEAIFESPREWHS